MIDTPPAIIEVYYDSRCAPCKRELPVLAEAMGEDLPLAIVILGDEAQARTDLREVSSALLGRTRGVGVQDPRAVLRSAGNDDGTLPYARSVRVDGLVCKSWRGMLSLEKIRALLAACK